MVGRDCTVGEHTPGETAEGGVEGEDAVDNGEHGSWWLRRGVSFWRGVGCWCIIENGEESVGGYETTEEQNLSQEKQPVE